MTVPEQFGGSVNYVLSHSSRFDNQKRIDYDFAYMPFVITAIKNQMPGS